MDGRYRGASPGGCPHERRGGARGLQLVSVASQGVNNMTKVPAPAMQVPVLTPDGDQMQWRQA